MATDYTVSWGPLDSRVPPPLPSKEVFPSVASRRGLAGVRTAHGRCVHWRKDKHQTSRGGGRTLGSSGMAGFRD
eukprot:scaffold69420_cov28-Tisochrysis_lutea.AAC.4